MQVALGDLSLQSAWQQGPTPENFINAIKGFFFLIKELHPVFLGFYLQSLSAGASRIPAVLKR